MKGGAPILHRAEEYGQSRKLEPDEIGAMTLMAGIESVALAGAAGITVMIVQSLQGHDFSIWTALATGGVVGGLVFYFHIAQNFGELRDGLRAWRSIETFAPSQSESKPSRWRLPIPFFHKGDVRLLDMNDKLALPQPDSEPLLTPRRVLEILRASLENDGSFSRRTITRIRLSDGGKVTRGMWRELAAWLHQIGVLRQDFRGSYCLPCKIHTIEDLFEQLPGLAQLGGPGGQWAGLDTSNSQPAQCNDRGVDTLAERRRQRFLSLNCDVKTYKRGR